MTDNPLLNRVPGMHHDRIAEAEEAETTSIEMCVGLMALTISLLLLGVAVYDILSR